jgi:predicted kinase
MPKKRRATLLVITGLPCTGKTALARELERSLAWPLFSKDEIKEHLFAALGWSDREWSRKLSEASYDIMFAAARKLLVNGTSCILEGNFRHNRYDAFAHLVRDLDVHCAQIVCKASGDAIVQRFIARAHSGSRHPGHVDLQSLAELERELREGVATPAPLGGVVSEFDTNEISTERIAAYVREILCSGLTPNT